MAITAKANTTIITIIATMKFSRMEPPIIYNTLSIHGYLVPSICTVLGLICNDDCPHYWTITND